MIDSSIRRSALASFALLGCAFVVMSAADARHRRRRFAPPRQWVRDNVPEAVAVLGGAGQFASVGGRLQSVVDHDSALKSAQIAATAPATAGGPFELAVPGGGAHASLRFVGVKESKASLDQGAAVYRNVQPDVDLVAVHDPERLELAFLVDKLATTPELAFEASPPQGGSLRREAQTDALLLLDKGGRARFRIAPPVAIDAHGVHRIGRFELRDHTVKIAMRWDGLTAPIVVDPAITIPYWSIVSDARAPGAKVYDAASVSHETHAVFDSARGKAVFVRPARTPQPEDTIFLFGDASRGGHEGAVQRIAPTQRPAGIAMLTGNLDATAEWLRGYSLASETWQWDGSRWSIGESAALPGVIDPALAFDSKRGRTVLYGGAYPGIGCSINTAFNASTSTTPFFCRTSDVQDVTYEFDGTTWLAKRVTGSPPPRVRAGMAYDASRETVVLFGGRELETNDKNRRIDPYGPVFPENFTKGLLGDTWTYDGTTWKQVPTASPPPALESPQLVYDAGRKVVVLIGGRSADQTTKTDLLTIWEFDGTDWVQRLAPGDSTLPPSLRTRRGATAFWNAARNRVTLFGGTVDKLDGCALTDAEIAAQTTATASDPIAREKLAATGCLGGYVHDFWEWDGSALSATGPVAYGGNVGGRWVFRQVEGAAAWSTAGAGPVVAAAPPTQGPTLLPWRYDGRADHFAPRTTLARAHYTKPASTGPIVKATSSTVKTFASPLFVANGRPEVLFDASTGTATVFVDGATMFRTDGSTWTDVAPKSSPFADGPNDFYAAAWDTLANKTVLFDPRTGTTWTFAESTGWSALARGPSDPAKWSVDPTIRVQADLRLARAYAKSEDGAKLADVLKQLPKMVFDRAHGVTVMLYAGATWEFDGITWKRGLFPSSWTTCTSGVSVAYDSKRSKTVAYGCTMPASTWEWDGTTWAGPFASPYQAAVWRDRGDLAATIWDKSINWKGTLQSTWTHANAAFDSPSLGGVSMIDGDGTVRTWDGAAWKAGPQIADGYTCFVSRADGSTFDATRGLRNLDQSFPWPIDGNTLIGKDFLPLCFFPPVVEDAANQRILAFRDGPRGLLELPTASTETRAWRAATLGNSGAVAPWGGPLLTATHPYPFELMSPEHAYFKTMSDPTTRVHQDGTTTGSFDERRIPNLWWPFRLLSDPVNKRVRLLTNRGLIWELGGETLQGLGGACESNLDCATGECNSEKVCCESATCGDAICTTCKGTAPGKCEVLAAGVAEPRGRCGTGECAGSCGGTAGACAYDAFRACGSPASCAASVLTPAGHCAPNSAACVLPGAGPACPLRPDGSPDLTVLDTSGSTVVPCSSLPTPCSGGLSCETSSTCKTACKTRMDCSSKFETCSTSGTECVTDGVALEATARGIEPVSFKEPRLRSDQEIADILKDAGHPSDDAGVVYFPVTGSAGIVPAFDPARHTPLQGLRKCVNFVETCLVVAKPKSIDQCVVSARRCVSKTPWLGDPAGDDCCPEECLSTYLEARKTKSAAASLDAMGLSGCYPGN